MITAGLVGWLRFLPPGDASLVPWGELLVAVGTLAILFATAVGLTQTHPKTVLAYSSIGKMGVLTLGFGLALAEPQASAALLAALTVYAAHHLLVKGALFLGVDLALRAPLRPWVLAGLTLLALALAGAPFTSGALAKSTLLGAVPGDWGGVGWALALSAVASTLLMARFLFLVQRRRATARAPVPTAAAVPWAALTAAVLIWPWTAGDPAALLGGGATLLVGASLAAAAYRWSPPVLVGLVGRVPPGDLIALAPRVPWTPLTRSQQGGTERLRSLRDRAVLRGRTWIDALSGPRDAARGTPWTLAGGLWLAVGALLFLALAYPD